MRRLAIVLCTLSSVSLGCGDSEPAAQADTMGDGSGDAAEDSAPADTSAGDSEDASEPDTAQPDGVDGPDSIETADTRIETDTLGPVEREVPAVLGPERAIDADPAYGIVALDLKASEMRQRILDLNLPMYGYDNEFPGPTIQAYVGDEVRVHFVNDLPEPTTIHWHGLRIPDWMDGNPRIQAPVEPGGSFDYVFVVPEAGTFWYHPHVRTNEQVEKGLYGAFIVHEREPPTVDADRVFFLDDMLLDEAGFVPFLDTQMEAMHGRLGNTLVTNGKADTLELAAHKGQVERWRLLNPSNARTMSLSLTGAKWRVVGTDGGLIAEPYEVERLTLPVGQRYDLEVVYESEGKVTLASHVMSLNAAGDVEEIAIPVVEVDIGAALGEPTAVTWPEIAPLPAREPTEEVVLELNARSGMHGIEWTINGQAHSDDFLFRLPQGTTARIVIFNRAGPEHPFHLHGQFFEIVGRNAKPYADEPGLKDTVLIPGLENVELRAWLDNPGQWMAHCHILEHSELGMMAEFEVSAPVEP